ncbi:hypothetical protein BC628DRAFT_810517 [Trametes gibbosa]|nr:hypothetical protein BC628DRAFT_810517 [Trametes gibbosa]
MRRSSASTVSTISNGGMSSTLSLSYPSSCNSPLRYSSLAFWHFSGISIRPSLQSSPPSLGSLECSPSSLRSSLCTTTPVPISRLSTLSGHHDVFHTVSLCICPPSCRHPLMTTPRYPFRDHIMLNNGPHGGDISSSIDGRSLHSSCTQMRRHSLSRRMPEIQLQRRAPHAQTSASGSSIASLLPLSPSPQSCPVQASVPPPAHAPRSILAAHRGDVYVHPCTISPPLV